MDKFDISLITANKLDVTIIVIIVFALLKGWRRGFLGGLAGLLGYVIATWGATKYHASFAETLNKRYEITALMQRWLDVSAQGAGSIPAMGPTTGNGDGTLFSEWPTLSDPQSMTMFPYIQEAASYTVLYIVSFLMLFVLIRTACALLGNIASATLKSLPLLGNFERLGGMFLGFAEGILMAALIVMLLDLILPWVPMPGVEEMVQQSQSARLFLPIVKYFTPLLTRGWGELLQFAQTIRQ